MKQIDIPTLPIKSTADAGTQYVRNEAPKFLRSVIEKTHTIPFVKKLDDLNLEDVTPLAGGEEAATYLVLHGGEGVIVKFATRGLRAEAEALEEWSAKGVHVPKVYSYGIVPHTQSASQPIAYIVEEALVDKHGRLAETCEMYLHHTPEKARYVGRLMGSELTKLHSCLSERSFGDFADSAANTAAYGSWNTYLLDYFATQQDYLLEHHVTESQLEKIRKFMETCKYVKQGGYLHGDFSVRNAVILPARDSVALFDPNPVIGDPSWDVAVLYNNEAFSRRHKDYDEAQTDRWQRDHQLLIGFRQGYDRKISEPNLLTAQLVQSILHAT